ncbi:MAG: sodium-dependent transporter [Lachnospiraceae bacterium]|jgi:NSS family neurotransmitter:Na+ symporter
MQERQRLGSRLGFILLSAGCAIGVGNVWKFPFVTGQNGGGAFVFLYIIFLIILGVPVMTMEFAVGRKAQKSPVLMYQQIEKPGQKWHWHGYACLAGSVVLMIFYTTVAGWILYYLKASVTGELFGLSASQVGEAFNQTVASPQKTVICMIIVCVLASVVLSFSLQGGLEKITKVMMLALLVLMIVLAVHGLTLEGAGEAVSFYLKPDFGKITPGVVVSAMNQAFFTLSLGIGSMAIFGSYIDKSRSLMGESLNVIVLDTFVAIVAGLIIFPACFTYNVEVTAGPSLLFVALPNVFNCMPMGRLWGTLFFLFMFFAAFSTVTAVLEALFSGVRELTGWSRRKAAAVCGICVAILSLPCALGFNVLSWIQPFGEGSTIMDVEDFIVSNCLLPLGSMIFVLFCTWKSGWGFDNFLEEANAGKGLKFPRGIKGYVKYVMPVIILVIFVIGVIDFFG